MKIKKQEITEEKILEQWRQGHTSLDWRPLTIKEKSAWLKACLQWSGIPNRKIKSFNYIINGIQVSCSLDLYCLLGESFFGYRGYFGQDPHGFVDCFTEIFIRDKIIVEEGAKVTIQNFKHVQNVLEDELQHILDTFRAKGFEVELK